MHETGNVVPPNIYLPHSRRNKLLQQLPAAEVYRSQPKPPLHDSRDLAAESPSVTKTANDARSHVLSNAEADTSHCFSKGTCWLQPGL